MKVLHALLPLFFLLTPPVFAEKAADTEEVNHSNFSDKLEPYLDNAEDILKGALKNIKRHKRRNQNLYLTAALLKGRMFNYEKRRFRGEEKERKHKSTVLEDILSGLQSKKLDFRFDPSCDDGTIAYVPATQAPWGQATSYSIYICAHFFKVYEFVAPLSRGYTLPNNELVRLRAGSLLRYQLSEKIRQQAIIHEVAHVVLNHAVPNGRYSAKEHADSECEAMAADMWAMHLGRGDWVNNKGYYHGNHCPTSSSFVEPPEESESPFYRYEIIERSSAQ